MVGECIRSGVVWTVVKDVARDSGGRRRVLAECVCGVQKEVDHYTIKRGTSKGCGCRAVKHSHSRSRNGKPSATYVSWQSMRTRCLNPNSVDYAEYGGRGISIDAAWDSFERFLSDMGERPVDTSLDRKDVNGPYSLANCRWADPITQRANQRPHKRSVCIKSSSST